MSPVIKLVGAEFKVLGGSGMLSLEMGVFGGIVVGLGVSYLHNRFYQIQLPNVISFYEGERFVPIVCAITYVFVGVIMYFVWPPLQHGVYNLGRLISDSGYFGAFIFERLTGYNLVINILSSSLMLISTIAEGLPDTFLLFFILM